MAKRSTSSRPTTRATSVTEERAPSTPEPSRSGPEEPTTIASPAESLPEVQVPTAEPELTNYPHTGVPTSAVWDLAQQLVAAVGAYGRGQISWDNVVVIADALDALLPPRAD